MMKIWKDIFNIHIVIDFDIELTRDYLEDTSLKINSSLLYIHSMETFIYPTIDAAERIKDLTKVDTLGPFSFVLYKIL